jgi:hypothetical protein
MSGGSLREKKSRNRVHEPVFHRISRVLRVFPQHGHEMTTSTDPPSCKNSGTLGLMSVDTDGNWKWSYSGWVGIMYGPIPVGIILVVIGIAVYYGVLE